MVEKLAMASVAAEEAAEAQRMALTADAARQTAAREAADAKAAASEKKMIEADDQWSGDDFVDQSDALARG